MLAKWDGLMRCLWVNNFVIDNGLYYLWFCWQAWLWIYLHNNCMFTHTQKVYIECYHIMSFRRHGWLDTIEHMALGMSLEMIKKQISLLIDLKWTIWELDDVILSWKRYWQTSQLNAYCFLCRWLASLFPPPVSFHRTDYTHQKLGKG